MREKIVLLIPAYTLGGVETQAYYLAKHFKENGYDVFFIATRGEKGPLCDKLEALNIPYDFFYGFSDFTKKSGFQKIKILWQYIFFLRRLKPTYLLPFTEPINSITNLVSRFTGCKKSIYTIRKGFANHEQMNTMDKLVKHSSPLYVANSSQGAKGLEQKFKLRQNTVKVVLNGIESLDENQLKPEYWFNELQLSKEDFIFVMVANFFNEKNHVLLLKAWEEFIKHTDIFDRNKPKLLLIGGPSKFDRDYFKIKAEVLDKKLYDSIIFVDPTTDIHSILAISKVGVLLTFSEGCPNAVIEYTQHSLPIIASNIPAITEILGSNYSLLVNNNDASKLESLLLDTYINYAKYKSATQGIKNEVADKYSIENLKKSYSMLLN